MFPRISLAPVLLLSFIPLVLAADEDPATRQVELKKGDKIIFFGDSLTNLAGEEKPKEHVKKGYVNIVREKLQEKHKDKNIEVDWVATGGHTVPDLINRVDKDVIARSRPSSSFRSAATMLAAFPKTNSNPAWKS